MGDTTTATVTVVTELDELTDALSGQSEVEYDGTAKDLDRESKSIASRFLKRLTATRAALTELNGQIALAILLTFRFAIKFNGRPDMEGRSDAYRKAFQVTINRLMPMPEGLNESEQKSHKMARASYSDTIGKRMQRMMFREAVKFVNERDSIGVNDAEIERLIGLDYKQIKDEMPNRKNAKLIANVNYMYDAGNNKRSVKHPRSQWERDNREVGSNGSGNGNASNKDAEANRATVKRFGTAVASKNVDASQSLFSMADALVSIQPIVSGSKPRYGKGGKSEVNRMLDMIVDLAIGVRADVNGKKLSDELNDRYCDAWDAIVGTEDDDDQDNDN